MKKSFFAFALGMLALLAFLAGDMLGEQKFQSRDALPTATLADLKLPDIDKKLRTGNEWLGKVVVVNHWATWCPPCREEIPLLIDAQRQFGDRGVQMVGIAHDLLDATRAYSDRIGINYPSLVALHGNNALLRQHGNAPAALPFTAFFARDGRLVSSKLGQLSRAELQQAIVPLL